MAKQAKFISILIVAIVVAANFLPLPAQAVATLLCNTTQYQAGNTITCRFNGDIPIEANKNYGVFWFYDVPQAAIDSNWEFRHDANQRKFFLGNGPNQVEVSEIQRVSGTELQQTQGQVTKTIDVTRFRPPVSGTPNNLVVVVQELIFAFTQESLRGPEGRGEGNIQFLIPQGEQFSISARDSERGFRWRVLSAVYSRDGQIVTEGIQVLWKVDDELIFAAAKPITDSFEHSFLRDGTYTVTASANIGGVEQTAQKQVVISETETQSQREGGSSLGKGADTLGGTLISAVNIVLGAIIALLRWIMWTLGTLIFVPLLDTTLSIDASQISDTILFGWQFVRDIVNMAFVLILIAIGFATMLRIESYNYKKLLVNLIMMALLVNFSLLIGRIIIQVADTAQFTFLPETVSVEAGQGDELGVTGVRYLFQSLVTVNVQSLGDGVRNLTADTAEAIANTFSLLFQFILELGVIITFAALAIFMLIRTIALWILLILSPVAFALNILPATSSYAKQWWTNFIKYALFAPIIAFFLRLTLVLYQRGLNIIDGSLEAAPDFVAYQRLLSDQGQITFGDTLGIAMVYIVILAFLWAGMYVTKSMGIAGAGAIVGLAEQGMRAPFKYGAKGVGYATGFASRKLGKAIGVDLSPHSWVEKYKQYREKRIREDELDTAAKAEERRKTAKTRFGSEFASKLGSPYDFYRTFLNPKEWKRMREGGQPAAQEHYEDAKRQSDDINQYIEESKYKELVLERDMKNSQSLNIAKGVMTNSVDIDKTTDAGKLNRELLVEVVHNLSGQAAQMRKDYRDKEAKALEDQIKNITDQVAAGSNTVSYNPSNDAGEEIHKLFKDVGKQLLNESRKIDHSLHIDGDPLKDEKTKISDTDMSTKKAGMLATIKKGDALRAPETYEHQVARIKMESEEAKGLQGIENADRLVALLHESENSGNKFRYAAILKKLAEDYNDNEAYNSYRDERFLDGRSIASGGIDANQQFLKQVLTKKGGLNMDQESAMHLIDEMAYINESRKHWANARLVKYQRGELVFNTPKEQAIAANVELSKQGARGIGQLNRLGIGPEIQAADGVRSFEANEHTKLFAKSMGPALAASNQMNHATSSMLSRLNMPHVKVELNKIGVDRKFMNQVEVNLGKQDVNMSDLADRV